MKIPNQKKVWDSIAKEWTEFKVPGQKTLEFVKKQKGKILDLGSGSGRYLIKKRDLKFFLIDFSEEMINLAIKKAKKLGIEIETKVCELDKIPYMDNFFDSAIYSNSLHCLITKEKRNNSLKELYRVLKPGAQAKIAVWNKDSKRFKNSPKERLTKWREIGERFYYLYNPEELIADIKTTGFEIIQTGNIFREIPLIVRKPKN